MSLSKPCISFFRTFTTVLRAPNGIRTRVTAVKGRCPRPLDDGDVRGWAILPAFERATKPDKQAQKSHQVAFAGSGGFLLSIERLS
jgi:hypothetical protein